jgi:hypothetical protein
MGVRATLQTLTINGKQLTPTGDASFPMANNSYEAIDNLDDSIDFAYAPGGESASLSVAGNAATVAHINSTMSISPGSWTLSGYTRDGQTVQMSNCGIVNKPSIGNDGAIPLEIRGKVRWS